MNQQIKELDTSSLPTTLDQTTSVVPFREIGTMEGISMEVNRFYQIGAKELANHLYLPVKRGRGTEVVFSGSKYNTRGREVGDIGKPVVIQDKNGYQTVGIITSKGSGLRNPEESGDLVYHKGSAGLLGIEEATLDAGFGNILRENGANIGDCLAIIRIPPTMFMDFLLRSGADEYAKVLKSNGFEERTLIPVIVRLTDPERLEDVFNNLRNTLISALWMGAEYRINGKERYLQRYQLPENYTTHLKDLSESTFGDNEAKNHAKLLLFMIIRDYVISEQLHLNVDFSERQIGNMGKLHDFSTVLDLETTTNFHKPLTSTESLAITIADIFMARGKFLDEEAFQEVIATAQTIFDYNLEPLKATTMERFPSFRRKYELFPI